jgi:sodium transport system permease protein
VPPPLVLFALAVAPAVGEEFFFRGYLLGALRGKFSAWSAIGITAVVFGLFHASVGGLIAVERVLSSTLLGLALGWICSRTKSIFPGMLLHVLHNSLMLSLIYFGPRLQAWGWDIEGQKFLPIWLLATTSVIAAAAAWVLATATKSTAESTKATLIVETITPEPASISRP